VVDLQPGGQEADLLGRRGGEGLDRGIGSDLDQRLVGERRRGDVEPAAVDQDVAVDDELARLAPGRGEAEPEDDVVEAALEQLQQRLAGGRITVAAPGPRICRSRTP
jgi:hypothetical protein